MELMLFPVFQVFFCPSWQNHHFWLKFVKKWFLVFPGLFTGMAQVEKQLKASQKFLTGLKGLPNFPPLRQKQLQQVFSALDKSPNFGTEKASEIFDLLDEGIWDEEAIVAIKEKVANKTEEGLWKERRGMQNFARIVEFLPTSLWNGLQTSQSVERRVELLTRFMASLGLRCPSEPTLAVIMTVAGCLFGMNAGLTEEGKLDLLQVYKPRIRKWLNQERPPVEYMLELPPRWQDLPQEVQEKVYAADDFPKLPAGIDLSTIDFAVRSFLCAGVVQLHLRLWRLVLPRQTLCWQWAVWWQVSCRVLRGAWAMWGLRSRHKVRQVRIRVTWLWWICPRTKKYLRMSPNLWTSLLRQGGKCKKHWLRPVLKRKQIWLISVWPRLMRRLQRQDRRSRSIWMLWGMVWGPSHLRMTRWLSVLQWSVQPPRPSRSLHRSLRVWWSGQHRRNQWQSRLRRLLRQTQKRQTVRGCWHPFHKA